MQLKREAIRGGHAQPAVDLVRKGVLPQGGRREAGAARGGGLCHGGDPRGLCVDGGEEPLDKLQRHLIQAAIAKRRELPLEVCHLAGLHAGGLELGGHGGGGGDGSGDGGGHDGEDGFVGGVPGGQGNGAIATVVTTDTDITSVTITTEGRGYAIGDVLTISASMINSLLQSHNVDTNSKRNNYDETKQKYVDESDIINEQFYYDINIAEELEFEEL